MKKNTRKRKPPAPKVPVPTKAKVPPPRNLTPELCDRLRRDMMKACLAVAETHGLTVEGRELSDIDLRHSFEITFRVGIPQKDGAIYSPDKAMFEVLAPHFGLDDISCSPLGWSLNPDCRDHQNPKPTFSLTSRR